MAINNFVPELWSAAVQLPFEKALVFGQPSVVNRDYEGTIKQQGDTVNVTTISDPTIKTYDKGSDIEIEDVSDANIKLVIDRGDYFAFRVNDLDRVQAAGDFQSPATQRAGFGLKDKVDKFIASQFERPAGDGVTQGGPKNALGTLKVINGVGGNTPGTGQLTAYDVLVKLANALNKENTPTDGRYVIIDPDFLAALQHDPRFSRVDASGSEETLRNGIVGRALGFDVLTSNNMTGGLVCAGIPGALSFANQLTEVEALREQKRFADVVRGLNVYGAKIFHPEGLATAKCTFEDSTAGATTAP